MSIVVIASESRASSVFAELQALGTAWQPDAEVPWLVYLEAESIEAASRIPGVRACWKGRCGALARLLHSVGKDTLPSDIKAAASLCIGPSAQDTPAHA